MEEYKRGYNACNRKWKENIQHKIEELNKKEKQELKGTKGQDRYDIKQQYMYQRNVLQDLLEEKGE